MGQAKRERTDIYFLEVRKRLIAEQIQNQIEQYLFDKLLKSGVVIKSTSEKEILSCFI